MITELSFLGELLKIWLIEFRFHRELHTVVEPAYLKIKKTKFKTNNESCSCFLLKVKRTVLEIIRQERPVLVTYERMQRKHINTQLNIINQRGAYRCD